MTSSTEGQKCGDTFPPQDSKENFCNVISRDNRNEPTELTSHNSEALDIKEKVSCKFLLMRQISKYKNLNDVTSTLRPKMDTISL